MKAAQINEYGGPKVLHLAPDAPKPTLQPNQVLVAVHAAGVNPFDYKVRKGYLQQVAPLQFPAILGGDCAGVVAEVGEKVTQFRVGDEVYGQANSLSGQGSYAEFTPVSASALAKKPQSIDMVMAAALPLAGVSAYQALVENLELQQGQKILIHGGAGGIGSLAIQLAKHFGAYTATTVVADDAEFAKQLGADEIIDYQSEKFETRLHGYDAVYDTVGGDTYKRSFEVLKPGGRIVSMVEREAHDLDNKHRVTAIYQGTKVTTERLEKLAALVDAGVSKTQIDKTFPLEQTGEAQAYIESSSHHGKVVIVVGQAN